MGPQKKTVARSFRIGEAALKALEEDAVRQKVSVNTLLNQLLTAYTIFDRKYKRFHPIKISHFTFRRILDSCPEETISTVADFAGKNVAKTFILADKGGLMLEGIIDYLRLISDYANWFEYSEVQRGAKRIVTLSHDLGRNGSVFISRYVDALLGLVNAQAKINLAEDSITFEL